MLDDDLLFFCVPSAYNASLCVAVWRNAEQRTLKQLPNRPVQLSAETIARFMISSALVKQVSPPAELKLARFVYLSSLYCARHALLIGLCSSIKR